MPRSLRTALPTEGRVLSISLALVVSAWSFLLLAGRVTGGKTQAFDEELLIAMRRPQDLSIPIGPPWLESLAIEFTSLGGVVVLYTLVGIVAGYLALLRRFGMMWAVIAATLGGGFLSSVLKDIVERGRPSVVPHLAHVRSASFPSGHSMLSAVVYLTLGALLARNTANASLRLYFLGVAVVMTFLIGATRIYLGVHYPSDVLAGWCAGLSWALLWELVAQRLQRRGVVSEPEA